MKHLSYVLTLVLIFFVACRRQQSVSTPLNAAERILKDNPDSAFRIIQVFLILINWIRKI